MYLLNGYARTIAFSYSAPYSNSALTEGFAVSASYTNNREIPYATTTRNDLLFYKADDFVRDNFAVSGSYIKRKGFYKRHVYSLGYSYTKVDDSINIKNPTYFNNSRSTTSYPDLQYQFQYVNVDNVLFALKGKAFSFSALKRGLGFTGGINMLMFDATYSRFIPHGRNWYSSFQLMAKVKAPFDLAYINRRAMGYFDFYLRGLEYFVIDGVASGIGKYTLKKKILSFDIPVPFKIRAIPKIPFAFFAKTFGDIGTSYLPNSRSMLNNRLLYSGGFGLDILTLYDINLSLEYSFNQLGQNGLFLHTKGGF
jgi:hypothetical protein